jgi:CBS domain-containing protein
MSRVRNIMTMNPACCTTDTRLVEVAALMVTNDCGEIPVVSNFHEKKLVGVITDRDICCRAVARGLNPNAMKAKDVMTTPAITASVDMSTDECIQLMELKKVRRLPVVDDRGNCCGMVALADIAIMEKEQLSGSLLKTISNPDESKDKN